MNKTELIAAVAEKSGLSKKDADNAVNAMLEAIVETLSKEEKVQLVGFGTFEVRSRSERQGRDPRTNAPITIPASKSPAFKAGPVRLDKYLKVSRIIKRRTVANEACDAGRVLVNGKPARASYDVKVGDVLELQLGSRPIRAKVLDVSETVRKEAASDLYQILE